jgi:OPT family small oligopeptide transporter
MSKDSKRAVTEEQTEVSSGSEIDLATGFGEIVSSGRKSLVDIEVVESAKSDELPADLADIPRIVRESVPLEDDPSVPVVTFRYVVLAVLFVIPGAFIDTMNLYRTTSAAYSIFFVQIASHWAGKFMARVVPAKRVRLLGGRIDFNLNPGPWLIKETALVTITASSGATGSLGTLGISLAEIYYGEKVNAAVAIFYMWAIVFTGYAFAALARNMLLFDPQFVWPTALMQTNLMQLQRRADQDSKLGSRQMTVFFCVLVGVTVWQFFPEFVFPMALLLAFLCWVAPGNATANFVGSGLGGMGFLNLTLDWSNITSLIMLYPYFVQVIQFVAFVIGAWVLIPAVKWGSLSLYKHGLMSNSLFLGNGTKYPVAQILTADLRLNETAYHELGPVHIGAQRAWNNFFDYASYISGIVWLLVFGHKQLIASFVKLRNTFRQKEGGGGGGGGSINLQYSDRINQMQTHYAQVPLWWYVALFGATFVILITIFATGHMFMPWWAYFVALGFGLVIVTPLCWLYALTNFQLAIGSFNEVLYGYMVQNIAGRHPVGATTYGAIAGDIFYRAQYMLQDQKIGHYMQLPPKVVFFLQIFGELLGVPINYAAMRWILNTKMEYLNGNKTDHLHQWTGQSISLYQTNAVQYVVLGPKRTFANYPVLPYGFLLGFAVPVVLGVLHRYTRTTALRRLRFDLWNTTVFFLAMSGFYGNVSTGYLSQFIGGTVTMFWAFRYKHDLWRRYNYILAAAMDTGYNLSVLLIFLFFATGKTVEMPAWWGNNAKNIERCFALE